MRFCPRCGTPREFNFCRTCGHAYEVQIDHPLFEPEPVVEESTQTSPTRIDVAYGDGFNPELHCTNCGEPKAPGFESCLLCGEKK